MDDNYDDVYPDETPTYLFGKPFAQWFDAGCTSRFEFVDFFAEHNAGLNRHMDYNTGQVQGYDYGASFSFLVNDSGKEYRVNIVMCSRIHCDSWIKKFVQGDYNKKKNRKSFCSNSTNESRKLAMKNYPNFRKVIADFKNNDTIEKMKNKYGAN